MSRPWSCTRVWYFILGSVSKRRLGKLSTLQKKALWVLADKGYAAHSDPLFLKLDILKIKDMIKFNSVVFMFKYMNGKLPLSFNGMFLALAWPNRTKSCKFVSLCLDTY